MLDDWFEEWIGGRFLMWMDMCMKGRTGYSKAKARRPMDAGDDGAWAYQISADCPVPLPPSWPMSASPKRL